MKLGYSNNQEEPNSEGRIHSICDLFSKRRCYFFFYAEIHSVKRVTIIISFNVLFTSNKRHRWKNFDLSRKLTDATTITERSDARRPIYIRTNLFTTKISVFISIERRECHQVLSCSSSLTSCLNKKHNIFLHKIHTTDRYLNNFTRRSVPVSIENPKIKDPEI